LKSANGRLSVTAPAKADLTDKASSPSFAADVLIYYERTARSNSDDRELIIRMGFQEWLLAAASVREEPAAAQSRRCLREPFPERRESEIVILIANLIGGAQNEP
jgi:hypothetical protein